MSQPTIEQIERLPKWAQSHIRQLDRQRRITNLAYQPREYESLMHRKKQAEENQKTT